MKKSRLFMATGALVLAVSALFATKANKKFTFSVITGYSNLGASTFEIKTTGGHAWLTESHGTGLSRAIFTVSTASGKILLQTLLVASGGTTGLYY